MPSTTKIASLASKIINSPKNLNSIVELLKLSKSPETTVPALVALSSVFLAIRNNSDFDKAHDWIDENYKLFKSCLLKNIHNLDVLDASLEQLKEQSVSVSLKHDKLVFANAFFIQICNACFVHQEMLDPWVNLLNKYADLRFFFYRNVAKLDKKCTNFALELLLKLDSSDLETEFEFYIQDDSIQPLIEKGLISSKKEHANAFSSCWIDILRSKLSAEMYQRVLVSLDSKIMPHLVDPTLLIDFLTESYNAGGVCGMLSLDGLFTLITKHNLDYPDFYKKLYAYLDNKIHFVKYKSRFYSMLAIFLSSTHLSANLVASFIKRLARGLLVAPPTSSQVLIPMIYNLLILHPSCLVLIHNTRNFDEYSDPFDQDCQDPEQSGAIESSLWEILALKNHYHPGISGLIKVFENQLTRSAFDLDDFLSVTWDDMIKSTEYGDIDTAAMYDGGKIVLDNTLF